MIAENNIRPFEQHSGSARLGQPRSFFILFLLVLFTGLLSGLMGVMGVAGCAGIILFIVYGVILFRNPAVGFYTAVALSFILIGAGRYVKDVQVGLGMDAILVLTYLALFINQFQNRINWGPARKDITFLAFVWLCYSLFEIVNPEAKSFAAWFSGRGIGVYMFLLVPLALLFINTNKRLNVFLYIWGAFSILATLKAIMQVKMGVDSFEQQWLNDGNYKTHILFGKLRAFSFLSDAGQFGANQGYSAVVAIISAIAMKGWKNKLFFYTVGLLALYGMVISGTRGAMSVPLAGFALYFILRKNKAVMVTGAVLLVAVFYFFKFTSIGQGNAEIRRMRTAFDPNDASLQVRLSNQNLLKSYMASRPFGGGIGHGGVKAQRFLPNAYLSQIPTDSWYVLIWVEQGVVGLLLHLFILFYILIKASYKIMYRIRDPELKLKMAGLAAGMFGVMVASYGNAVLGQMPTNILLYISMAVLLSADRLDNAVASEKLQPATHE